MKQQVVVILGGPASGKSTAAQRYEVLGYQKLNRDTIGGLTDDLIPYLKAFLKEGRSVVLDNVYMTKASRKPVIEAAKKLNIPVKCEWVTTSLEESQYNASMRMVKAYGKLLGPEEIKIASKKDPSCIPPAPLFVYRNAFEKPSTAEGFSEVIEKPFKRVYGSAYVNKALLLDKDGTLTECISGGKFPCTASDVRAIAGRGSILKAYMDKGYKLLGVTNQSGVAKGSLSETALKEILSTTNKLLGVDIEWAYCPHSIPPVSCFCRKPSSGLGVEFIERYKLNPSECIMVGDSTSDNTFAKRCGFKFAHERDFFK